MTLLELADALMYAANTDGDNGVADMSETTLKYRNEIRRRYDAVAALGGAAHVEQVRAILDGEA